MWTKIDYKDIRFLHCTINYAGKAIVKYDYRKTGAFKGKDAFFSDTSTSFYEGLDSHIYSAPKPGLGQKLFISKNSKMPRALLRGSDYKIVLDKDKADYVVVPFPEDIITQKLNLVMKCGDVIYCVRITKDYGAPAIDDQIVATVQQSLSNYIGGDAKLFFHKSDLETRRFYFVKRCDEYEQMLADSTSYKFYFDRNVPFVPTTEINPENLEFLYRCRDMNVFERMVFGSDWQHYPFTICTLLYMHERYYGGQSLKLIEEAIHFNDYYEGGYNGNREHDTAVDDVPPRS